MLIKKLTSYTKYYGVVNIRGEQQGVTRFANSEISQNINQSDISVSLTLHDGKKEAVCTTNVLDDDGLQQLARDTESLLEISPEGDFDANPWKKITLPNYENDAELAVSYDAEGRVEAIKKGISSLKADCTAAGALILEKKIAAYGNSESSEGDILFADLDNVQFNTVVTRNGADGGAECLSHRAGELNIPGAFLKANDRAILGSDPVTLDGGEYTVVLSPQALGDLVFYITWSLNAKRIADGMSFCVADLTESPAFGKNISIYDDVNDPRVFPWYFDYEGYKRRPLPLVDKGVVKNILCDTKTGSPTGHAYSNKGLGGASLHTVMPGGGVPEKELVRFTERGLFISEFHYTNFVNPRTLQVTGLTRNGTFLIEGGEITRAVNTMRFTQNLLEAFNNVKALSKDLVTINNDGWAAVMPSALIERFCFP